MTSRKMDRDLTHLNAFPLRKKEKVLSSIMEHPAAEEHVYDGDHSYENTITRLRAKGYELIDLKPQENAFTMVWYRKTRTWFGLRLSEAAAMLVWEFNTSGEHTTVRMWQL